MDNLIELQSCWRRYNNPYGLLSLLYIFFEILTQHVDEEYFYGPTIFITFDFMIKKLLYNM